MPQVTVTVGQDGRLCGLTSADQELYQRFRNRVESIGPGDVLTFSWEPPRSAGLHRYHFKLLGRIFDNQEVFRSHDEFRQFVLLGAGHVIVMHACGIEFQMADSVSYEQLDDDKFRDVHKRVMAFLLTEKALRKLWPHADVNTSFQAVKWMMEQDR